MCPFLDSARKKEGSEQTEVTLGSAVLAVLRLANNQLLGFTAVFNVAQKA